MGSRDRYLGAEVPAVDPPWQDPIAKFDHETIDEADTVALNAKILVTGMSISALVATAWVGPRRIAFRISGAAARRCRSPT